MFSLNPTIQDIFQARIFEEPLVPVGADPTPAENAALSAALQGYSKRSRLDDFSSLTEFIEAHPKSAWNAALLTNLGLEYYNTGRYSKTLEVWTQAWVLARAATDLKGKALANRAVGELAYMHARLGQMTELQALLTSIEGRVLSGPATERITGAREGLSNMQTRPEIAFRCGPLALHQIKLSMDAQNPGRELILASEFTQRGCSLRQVAALSYELGLNFQMVYREKEATFVVPSVVHLKVDHYAAIVRQEGDRYLLQDPTFGNDVWVTRDALEAETSGYFLIPPGERARGWRAVEAEEGERVWGKGNTTSNDDKPHGCSDPATPGGNSCRKPEDCKGMAVPRVHLMLVSLNINDEPVGYSPPLGPAVRFTVRYNQRDAHQPGNFNYSNLGAKWTFDWLSYIKDDPSSPSADVTYYMMGGGTRTFTGFSSGTQTYAFQQFDQTKLTRTSPDTYEMLSRDGSRKVFSQSDGATGTSRVKRKIFLTQLIDPFGNAVSLTYDTNLRVVAITDAIDQVTTIAYEHLTDIFKITKVTDPFGRYATFAYDVANRLIKITDVDGNISQFTYGVDDAEHNPSDFITTLTTPYGVTRFTKTESGRTRSLETIYPDGDRDRVEYAHSPTGILNADPNQSVPVGMATRNEFLVFRNTFYWSKMACACAYGDYTKARIYHWLHTTNIAVTAGILESVKEPLESRVWYDYAGQSSAHGPIVVGSSNKPTHVGRVLDDGSTQLYTYEYNGFGNITKMIDPVGRTFSYVYAANGIDLLETRQTRAGQNQLLSERTFNSQHLPLTAKDAAGQTTTYTYNTRGQMLTETNARNETTTYSYDANGYLTTIDGPLSGTDDSTTFTYDSVGRVRTQTDESGYTHTFDYDKLDRLTKITFPDATFDEFTYTRLDLTVAQDRAGRQTAFEYDGVRRMTKRIDPSNRVTRYQWCKCGDLKSLTDPMGRTTSWRHDLQGRIKCKEYVDGSKVTYRYENAISRLRQKVDEKRQVTQYNYNRDDTVRQISYTNATIATPTVAFSYDANYNRLSSMTDGRGTTRYSYVPITPAPYLGAGQLGRVEGPLANDAITFAYDNLGRLVSRAVNGRTATVVFDAANRVIRETNDLGTFVYAYEGSSRRRSTITYPNGLTATFGYLDNRSDRRIERITHTQEGRVMSEFVYTYDVPANRITTWSQKVAGQESLIYTFAYDAVSQLTLASESQGEDAVKTFAYTYDLAGNRLAEQVDGSTRQFTYNALNQLTTAEPGPAIPATYRWDAEHRVVSVQAGPRLTVFEYDGFGRRVGIREQVDGVEESNKRFTWAGTELCEERTAAGTVVKVFLPQGIKVEEGATGGKYFYTRDHLGSVRELIDDAGIVRAQFHYDPYGLRSRIAGDLESDVGFTGHLYHAGTGLNLTWFRAYDPVLARWLSRDPLESAEMNDPNLYSYVGNNPINTIDANGAQKTPDPSPGGPVDPTGPTVPAPSPVGPTVPAPPNNPPAPYPGDPRKPRIPGPPKLPTIPDYVWVILVICGVLLFVRVPVPV